MTDNARPLPSAIADVIKERHRQIREEGYTEAHDDSHVRGELVDAALAYVMKSDPNTDGGFAASNVWPFKGEPMLYDRRRALVIGAALFLAEIERLDRMAARS